MTQTASQIMSANIRAEMSRKDPKVTQEDLAAALRITQSPTARRLSGKLVWDVNEMVVVAQTLNVPIATLLAGIEVPIAA